MKNRTWDKVSLVTSFYSSQRPVRVPNIFLQTFDLINLGTQESKLEPPVLTHLGREPDNPAKYQTSFFEKERTAHRNGVECLWTEILWKQIHLCLIQSIYTESVPWCRIYRCVGLSEHPQNNCRDSSLLYTRDVQQEGYQFSSAIASCNSPILCVVHKRVPR